jgi:hypothetical protein
VVVIPALEEISTDAYDRHTRAYVDRLRADDVEVVEPYAALSPGDYIAGDGHLSRSGAEKVARAMVDSKR